jgi:hypothetical protein
MDTITWGNDFIEMLYKKFPKKKQLTVALMELLEIEREAVYRRLRNNVLFSAHEIVKIASAWNISLDEITHINSEQFSFHMRKINYLDPSTDEITFLKSVIQSINYLKDFPTTEFMDICNKLPRQLVAGYPYINKFLLFKWLYQYGSETETIPFSKTQISEEKLELTEEYNQAIKNVPNNHFIFDSRIFEFFVNDIRYFSSIYLITNIEKELIKKDLLALLAYLQEIANKGHYPETNCKVNLFISQINVDTNYSYTLSHEANICFVHVFEKFEIYTFDNDMITNFINWMQMKKRTSIQISEVDERSRIEFFSKQKALIEKL